MRLLCLLLCVVLAGCTMSNPFVKAPTAEERCLALVGPPGDEAYDNCLEQLS